MSESPPQNNEPEVAENRAASGEEPDMDRDADALQQGLGDFEVKEQDRWLPIANGTYPFACRCVILVLDLLSDLWITFPCATQLL